jgi:hypothetical protein
MNTTAFKLTNGVVSAIAVMGLTAHPATADTFFSRPPEPTIDKPTDMWLITSSDDGANFYAMTPYNSAQTADRNLYVNAAVMVKSSKIAGAKVVQIDCGNLRYREVMPGFAMNAQYKEPIGVEPDSYGWRRFNQGTAFLTVGKTLCDKAAGDRGLEWTWSQ